MPAERELIETFAVLIGTILEREHLLAAVKHAEILEASEQLRRALLHSVSHELKTPLAAVQTGIEALAVRTAQDGRAGATIFEVQSALRRLHRVINNLLSMSRIESGVVQTQLDWCDIGELIEGAWVAGDNLSDHKIAIECDPNAHDANRSSASRAVSVQSFAECRILEPQLDPHHDCSIRAGR